MATKKAAGKTTRKSGKTGSYKKAKSKPRPRVRPALALHEPIIITGGGSVNMLINPSQFRSQGGGHFRNGTASLSSIIINGGTPIPLTANSVIVVKMA